MPVRWLNAFQYRSFAMSAGLCALAFANVFRIGGVTPIERQRASFARATSQIELSDSVFDTWQQGIAATWLFGEKVRLRTLWAFAVSAMNWCGMPLTI